MTTIVVRRHARRGVMHGSDQQPGNVVLRPPNRGSPPEGEQRQWIELESVRGESLMIELEGDEPGWFMPTVQAFGQILLLPEDWNSYGARPVDPAAVAAALELLSRTMHPATPPPQVVPTNRGGVYLEWHMRGMDLEVKILERDRVYVYRDDLIRGRESEEELSTDLTPLIEILAELAQRS